MQHPVAVARRHGVWIDVVGQRQHAPEAAGEALVDVHGRLAVLGRQIHLALAGDGQHTLLDLDVDAGRVEAGGEGVNLDRLRSVADIHGRKAAAGETANARRQVVRLLEFPLQPIEFREQIARKQGSVEHGILLDEVTDAEDRYPCGRYRIQPSGFQDLETTLVFPYLGGIVSATHCGARFFDAVQGLLPDPRRTPERHGR